ncbi:right-handed parallel beta-helix repeat-containing protein [Halobaculum marinum]|uniref:Right-handed parallel beta-helix repeat-containing protein n=1 Tax=Halobaculum marinum TaxID=3031996 RepID=A0ABD5WZC0_9EURY|nr:right-handed parallel beta-helix repeat-containing protein [Halobaculum sp. DT55]
MPPTRRSLLRRLAPLSVAVATAGCGGAPTPVPPWRDPPDDGADDTGGTTTPVDAPTRLAREWGFDDAVDLTTVGADPTGTEPIDDVVRSAVDSERLLYLPEGRYRLDETVVADGSEGVDRIGLVGENATVVPADGKDDVLFGFGAGSPVDAAYCKGITFDFSAENTGGRPLLARASDAVLIEDVTVRGEADVDQDLFRIDVTGSAGSGTVRRLRLPDGAPADTKVTGCEVGDDNRGDLSFLDCEIAGFPDNGLYADPPHGSVRVVGGSYRNNGVAGVRVNAPDGDAVIRGVHVRCDDADGAGENMRGIRLRGGRSVLVEDCFVELLEVTSSDGAITFASELGAATVRNCLIRVDTDGVNAIRIKSPAGETTSEGPFVCDSITVVGDASDGAAIEAAYRSGVSFRELCVHQSGGDRDGVNLASVDGEFVDSVVAVTGDPFVLSESRLDRRNVSVPDAPVAVGRSGQTCGDRDVGSNLDME